MNFTDWSFYWYSKKQWFNLSQADIVFYQLHLYILTIINLCIYLSLVNYFQKYSHAVHHIDHVVTGKVCGVQQGSIVSLERK